jgi:hypothetical protein
MAFDPARIEEKIDRVVTGNIELSDEGGGIAIKRLIDAMEVAKMMSISGPAVPAFAQNQPGICYAFVVRAVRWGMDPFFVAEQSYLVKNPKSGEEKIAFMAQLLNAVINARAPLQKKLRAVYAGEGVDMKATIYGLPKGQTEELDFETPTLKELIAVKGRNEYGKVKGSPLYDTDPKQALWYYGARGFCRRHFPEVLAGVYDVDEFEPVEPKDVTPERPTLPQRLKDQKRIASPRGFDAAHVGQQIDPPGDASGSTTEAAPVEPAPLTGAAADPPAEVKA